MRTSVIAIAAAAFSVVAAGVAVSARADCGGIWPPEVPASVHKRAVTADDILSLRDMGATESDDPGSQLIALSPDGRDVALQLRQADPRTNTYCLVMLIVDVTTGDARVVDRGGELIRRVQSIHGLTDYPSGFVEPVVPQWSPDGQWIAWLRQDGNQVQVWRARADGGGAAAVTHQTVRPEAFAWTKDGTGIVVASRPGIRADEAAIDDEGRQGFVFDDRFVPFAGRRPFPRIGAPLTYSIIDVASAAERPASAEDLALMSPDAGHPPGALLAEQQSGMWVWTAAQSPDHINAPTMIKVGTGETERVICSDARCDKVRALLWGRGGDKVIWLNQTGDELSRLALYRASLPDGHIQKVLETGDALIGCIPAIAGLVCGHETSDRPRHLVGVDMTTGNMRVIFDPNPQFGELRLGTVQRLRWQNSLGIKTFGDLVLPPDHKAGERHPLIVVGYTSRGFLRGGTGDEYPAQLFAAQGFAVLNIQNAVSPGYLAGPKTWDEASRLDLENWTYRKSDLSSIEAGVAKAIATGMVDGSRVGMTGLSDGASGTQFDLINSHLFKAAVVSTCCDESFVINVLDGDGPLRWYRGMGYPSLTQQSAGFWQPMSLRQNAARMTTPLLMQLPDWEYLGALESYRALKEQGQPVELIVYPDEFHFKWQPAHREAIYLRNVDWFDFWLNGKVDPDPAKAAQYARWQRLKAPQPQTSSASPGG